MSTGEEFDRAGAVRPGEEMNVANLDAWLKRQVPDLLGTPKITQYSGGASNWTYRLEYENGDLILRRPPAGTKAKSAHNMGREYRIQTALKPVFPFVPNMLAYCGDESIIGDEFFVMERLNGIIPRKNLPRSLNLSPDIVRRLCLAVLDTLISLHRVDYKSAGLENIGSGAGYTQRQIEGWSKRYRDARTWNVPRGDRIMDWLLANLPAQERICVTHNDFRFDNVVLDPADPTHVIGVLDWELATLGDPLMDLGSMLAYWVQADDDFIARATRLQPTHLPGMLTRKEVVDYYCERMGFAPESWAFYEVYGLFRLSAIAQQIYYRYHHKQTRNPAFKNYWAIVNYLHWRCRRAMRERADVAIIHLLRHGQASFGENDYDRLSVRGVEQARVVGAALRGRGKPLELVICGSLKRHIQTADAALPATEHSYRLCIDADWDEFDHYSILSAYRSELADPDCLRREVMGAANPYGAFQAVLAEAVARWVGGEHDADYRESWSAFCARCDRALANLREQAKGLSGEIAVFTSGGPIAGVVKRLLDLPDRSAIELCWGLVNCGITKLVFGRNGVRLSTLNEHAHFDGLAPDLITYR